MSKPRILILGAGFGGLELSTILSEQLGDTAAVTVIDKSDAFVFGYAKLDVMFGRATTESIRNPYSNFAKPGVRLLRETITAIDPTTRRVTTNAGTHDADVLVVALGADYDVSQTPGVTLGKNEFYTIEGADHLRTVLPTFKGGAVVVGVCNAPYKCPPAPSECALMMHDYLTERGLRDKSTITIVNPLSAPVPPSPETSKALYEAFAEKGIAHMFTRKIVAVDEARQVAVLDDKTELPCQLFLGIPTNRAPDVVLASGMCEGGWVAVDPRTLETKYPDVYSVGDIAATGTPKAGLFAEVAAKTVAENVIAKLRSQDANARNPGRGTCYIQFGANTVASVEVDFFSGPKPVGTFVPPSEGMIANKQEFGAIRQKRWFR